MRVLKNAGIFALIIFKAVICFLKLAIVLFDVSILSPLLKIIEVVGEKINPSWQASITINLVLALGWVIATHLGRLAIIYFVISGAVACCLVLYPVALKFFQRKEEREQAFFS
jgi:hypothetical protein